MDLATARLRAALNRSLRHFFDTKGFLETEVPVASPYCIPEATIPLMTTLYTHPWLGSKQLHLLPSPEYYIKRLISKGWGSVYSLGRAFRDAENLGHIHNPEFTMLEYYAVGSDEIQTLALTDELLHTLVGELESAGRSIPAYARPPIRTMTVTEAFWDIAGSDLETWIPEDEELTESTASLETAQLAPPTAAVIRAKQEARRLGVPFSEEDEWDVIFQRIFLNRVEPGLPQDRPLALTGYPAAVACLAARASDPRFLRRWELYIRGIEIANAFAEERDPDRIRDFFRRESATLVAAGRTLFPDPVFAEIAASMAATSGVAIGWDRMIMVLLDLDHISKAMHFTLDQ